MARTYLVQKLLVLPSRKPEKRGKDLLYIHDTLQLFGDAFGDLRALWLEFVRPTMHPNTQCKLADAATKVFAAVTDDAREAVLIARETGKRPLDTDRFVSAGRYGLAQIFAGL